MKAIVIDDEPSIRETLEIMLQRKGWQCVLLQDGVGLDAYLEKYRPDIVITDYNLPGDDGLEIARRVKIKGVPCVVITGFMSSELQIKDKDIPFMQKPFTAKELDKKMKEIMLARG